MNYFLSQFVWDEPEEQRPGWVAPPGIESFLDLRNLTAQGTAQTQQGFALMAAHREPLPGETLIADASNARLTDRAKDAVRDLLGIPEKITAANMQGLIRRLLGIYSDPDEALLCPPLMPGRKGMLRFRLGEIQFASRCPTSGPYWDNIVKVLHQQYREARSLPRGMHRRLLTVWQKQFGVKDHEVFIPSDLPKELPLPHETTVRDNFDVGNHADLTGHTSSDGDWSWFKLAGSGTALMKTDNSDDAQATIGFGGYCTYIAAKDLSSIDQYVQGFLQSQQTNMYVGLLARKDSSGTETYYDVTLRMDTGHLRIRKAVSSVWTTLQSNVQAMSVDTPYLVRFVVDGSTLQTFFEGSQVGADLTDTAIAAGLRVGMTAEIGGSLTKTSHVEDFEGGDWPIELPPDPPTPYKIAVPYRTLIDMRYAMFTADDNMSPDFGPDKLTGEPSIFLGNGSGGAVYPMGILRIGDDGVLHAIGEQFDNDFGAVLWHKTSPSPYTEWSPATQHANKAGPLFDANFSGQCIGANVVRIPALTGPRYLASFQGIGSGMGVIGGNILASLIPLDGLPLPDSLTLSEWLQQCSLDSLAMLTQSIPDGQVGVAYTNTGGGSAIVRLVALGGRTPYSWDLLSDLPEGLTFDNSRITGTPTEAGTFTFSARVVDALGSIVTREFSITIAEP